MNLSWVYLIIVVSWVGVAAADVALLPVDIDVQDRAKLQRGAQFFMNYCSGCHSLRYMRYNRMANDLGLTTFAGEIDKDLLVNNLIFTKAEVQDPIQISMPEADARQWFGRLPPDLSLSAREHGSAWLYTYLKSFYADKKRPFGANNRLVPDVAMPNILAPLQGVVMAGQGSPHLNNRFLTQLVLVEQGKMSPAQFDSALQDLVTFLVYVAEPAKLVRYHIGFIVLGFLCVFAMVSYQLKKCYWRDVH